jgi:uncharacterized protein
MLSYFNLLSTRWLVCAKNSVLSWYNKNMIADRDMQVIKETAAKHGIKRIVLFGSSLSHDKESRDIDLGVEGFDEKDFFAFYGELLCALSKPVDIVDLSRKTRLVQLIEQGSVMLT